MTETRNAPSQGGGKSTPAAGKRTSPALFYKQSVGELRKVVWPTRQQLVTYTIVVLVFVMIMIGIVFALDQAFSKLVFFLFA